ncbi:MAG: DNA topoisomerase I [Nanopusillaceae archaeon]
MLIVAEKPSVARSIAIFLSNSNFKKIKFKNDVYYYYFNLDGENFYIVPSIGHLYTLSDLDKTYKYPTFNYKWVPAYFEDGIFIKKTYIEMFRKFSDEKEVIIATDYDIEGELIGYNILRFSLGRENAKRMIFSAITKQDILYSFENIKESIDYGLAIAGETRHIIDWLYGINLSRILTRSLRNYTKDYILSIGRVQGPTLKIVFEREKEIRSFIPEVYYLIYVDIKKEGKIFRLTYNEKIKSREEAEKIKERIKNKIKVLRVFSEKYNAQPPHPYNLTNVQIDAYKLYKISPKKTLDILQGLYEKGYISYPRTSSEILPNTINFRKIMENLSEIKKYAIYYSLLKNKPFLKPNNGKKEDIHPAIYPTGEIPDNLNKKEFLIYDLIVRRFFATFMDASIIEKEKIYFEENFFFEYEKCLNKGWMIVYWDILKNNFLEIKFKEGEFYEIVKKYIRKRKTSPPSRYNQASLIKKMEEENLGTKSTRAEIIVTLYNRKYIDGRSIKITKLGEKILEIFEKYFPDILDVDFTKKMEESLEKIAKNKYLSLKDKILSEAKEIIKNICNNVDEKKIGEEIYKVIKELEFNNR